MRTKKNAIQRILSKCIRTISGCLVYTGKLTKKGYPHVRDDNSKMRFAYILIHEHIHGPLPIGMEIDHICRNRACCEDTHLEIVTHQENIIRAVPYNKWGFARLPDDQRQEQARRAARARWDRLAEEKELV